MGSRSSLWRNGNGAPSTQSPSTSSRGRTRSPNEIVPLQIGLATWPGYPGLGPAEPGKTDFGGGVISSEGLLHPAGGSTIGAGFAGPKSYGDRGKRLWMLWRGDACHRRESAGSCVKLSRLWTVGVDSGE